jgi:DNA-binding response OmpR family regulator
MDGPEATKEIRALGYRAPIIGVTGNTLAMDLQRFEECGCNRVIGKPFSLELFQQYMAEAVRENRRVSVRILNRSSSRIANNRDSSRIVNRDSSLSRISIDSNRIVNGDT